MHTSLAATVPEALPSRFRSSPFLNCFTTVTVVSASGLNAVFRLSSQARASGAPAGGAVAGAGTRGSTAGPEELLPPQAVSTAAAARLRQRTAEMGIGGVGNGLGIFSSPVV